MLKRIFCILLCVWLAVTFTACQTVQYEYYSDAVEQESQDQTDQDEDAEKTKATKKTISKKTKKTTSEDIKTEETTKTTNTTNTDKPMKTITKTTKTSKTRTQSTTTETVSTTTKPSVPVQYEVQTEPIKEVVEDARGLTLGRIAWEGSSLRLPQALSGVRFAGMLTGEMSVELQVKSTPGTYMTIVIDGNYDKAETVWMENGTSTLQLAKNLSKGFHTVEVLRAGTAPYPETLVKEVTYCGQLEKPSYGDLQIEFIGDSITGGEGNWDDTQTKNTYSVQYCNSYETYAAKTARALGAEVNILAQCGWRMDHAIGWFNGWGTPDIVVINLGTNVYGITDGQIEYDLKTLLSNVRLAYGRDTYIVWAYGMMSVDKLSLIQGAVEEMGEQDEKILFCDLTSAQNQKGTNAHPDADGHTAAAKLLTTFLKQNCKDALKKQNATTTFVVVAFIILVV